MKDKFYEMAKNAILLEIETRDIEKILDRVQSDKSTEKSLTDFRKLTPSEQYNDSVRYGKIIYDYNMSTNKGFLTVLKILYLDKIFVFILLSGEVINCYEL